MSLKTAIDLGFKESDLWHDVGEPKRLAGFNGSVTKTLGVLQLGTQLGKKTRQVSFLVVPDSAHKLIIGIPALEVFGATIRLKDRAMICSASF